MKKEKKTEKEQELRTKAEENLRNTERDSKKFKADYEKELYLRTESERVKKKLESDLQELTVRMEAETKRAQTLTKETKKKGERIKSLCATAF